MLCEHSERIALVYALVLTEGSTEPIIMNKNLRMCKIIVRDANRWHEFEKGKCSKLLVIMDAFDRSTLNTSSVINLEPSTFECVRFVKYSIYN